MSSTVIQLDRRAVLKGLAGVTLGLPLLEAMGKEVAAKTLRLPSRTSQPRDELHERGSLLDRQ